MMSFLLGFLSGALVMFAVFVAHWTIKHKENHENIEARIQSLEWTVLNARKK